MRVEKNREISIETLMLNKVEKSHIAQSASTVYTVKGDEFGCQ